MAALKSLMVITIPIIFLSIFHNVASSERQQRFLDHHRQHMGDDEDASNDQPTELPRRQPARFYCPAKCECEIAEIATSVSANQSPVVALEPRKRYRNNYYTTYYASGAPDDESSPETRQKKMGVRGASVSVYCRRGNLTDVDFSEILQQITAPTVSDQQHLVVTTLEIIGVPHRPNAFRWNDNLNRLTRLRKLVLVNCAIPALSQALRMPALKHLDLSRNRIDAIQMGSFIGLPLLETLDLSHNQILTLPTGAFMYSKRLARLALSHNKISELASSMLRGPDRLVELELDGNRPLHAQQLNDLFIDVPSLERLELNNCGLNDKEADTLMLTRLPNLLRLGLGANNLTRVPTVQRALEHLRVIDLSRNSIRELGPCSFCASNISRVFLAHNLLGLGGVVTAPASETFRPASNSPWKRAAIHREAFAETQLVELDLSNNFYDNFDSEMLEGAQTSLQILHLSGNGISTLHDRLIHTLPEIQHLHMAENRIRSVSYALSKQYAQLTLLNLSGNALEELPANLARLLPSLQVFDISHNRFSISSTLMSTFIEGLDRVYLHNNPWDCECAVQNLQQYMLQRLSYKTELRYDETLCARPPLLRDHSLHHVERLNDCAILFGATHGLTQASELLLLLGALLVAAFLVSVLVILLLYCGREHKQKAVYVTHEQSRMHLTRPLDVSTETNSGTSTTTGSTLSEPVNSASALLISKQQLLNNNDTNAKNYMNGTLLKSETLKNGTFKKNIVDTTHTNSTLIRQPMTKAAAAHNQRLHHQQQKKQYQRGHLQQHRSPPPPGTMFVTF